LLKTTSLAGKKLILRMKRGLKPWQSLTIKWCTCFSGCQKCLYCYFICIFSRLSSPWSIFSAGIQSWKMSNDV